ncbi:hypothetical protein K432DRAFT_84538 [Lepidopterella palustris CBS 459.81]|uniref:Uncharacterized protein n=1 Tax=Lepidopterella palustris CBS 459.81 TaxID=1314670 RepID=A0A8E2JDU0_9PEZI|nr:hypothetical protein K432DRAFT_84538 [Lepidopterella palustris CBS 459.81]
MAARRGDHGLHINPSQLAATTRDTAHLSAGKPKITPRMIVCAWSLRGRAGCKSARCTWPQRVDSMRPSKGPEIYSPTPPLLALNIVLRACGRARRPSLLESLPCHRRHGRALWRLGTAPEERNAATMLIGHTHARAADLLWCGGAWLGKGKLSALPFVTGTPI